MMKELNFDTGLVTYKVNGKCEVSFNPTDSNFAERLYSSFETIGKKWDEYREQAEKMANDREAFDFYKARDAEMREMIDKVFDAPVSGALLGNMNVFTSFSGGFPVWVNIFFAVMDEMDATITREQKATNPRLQKYLAKYQKYQKK